jgi:murein DD-endopeptidase MepM/ murein hydrolase activator NlpD
MLMRHARLVLACSLISLALYVAFGAAYGLDVAAAQAPTPMAEGDTRIEVVSTPVPFVRPTRQPISNDPTVRVANLGESLRTIATQTGIGLPELARNNRLTLTGALQYGQVVRLPARATGNFRLHEATEADSVLSVAAQYGVSPLAVQRANKLPCADCIVPGTLLRIPQARVTSNLPDPFEDIQINPQLPQSGDVISIKVSTTQPLTRITGTLGDRPLRFAWDKDGYTALIGLGALQPAQIIPVNVQIVTAAGAKSEANSFVQLAEFSFGYENVFVSTGLSTLLQPRLNEAEAAELGQVYGGWSEEQLWSGPFRLPAAGDINSYFGARRNYNGGIYQGFHSGMDVRAWTGTPVRAAAKGRVAKVTKLPVRGIVVVLDHGRGVFTAYCHLSEPLVKEGQLVNTGDVVARSGNTGRSEGPHIHFELAVGGVQVNPLPWLSATLQ